MLTDLNGILHDVCEPNCGADGSHFKGIFSRNVQVYMKLPHVTQLKSFVERNADSIWTIDRGADNELGIVCSGPFRGAANASMQSSACDALGSSCRRPVTLNTLFLKYSDIPVSLCDK